LQLTCTGHQTDFFSQIQKKMIELQLNNQAETTAKAHRAVYRRALGNRLSDEDQWLLNRGEANRARAR
jgi:uncharacterized protein with gpF-like domain